MNPTTELIISMIVVFSIVLIVAVALDVLVYSRRKCRNRTCHCHTPEH